MEKETNVCSNLRGRNFVELFVFKTNWNDQLMELQVKRKMEVWRTYWILVIDVEKKYVTPDL